MASVDDKVAIEGEADWHFQTRIFKGWCDTATHLYAIQIAEMVLENRIMVSLMCMYSAKDGLIGDCIWYILEAGRWAALGS